MEILQSCGMPRASVMEIPQSCTKLFIWTFSIWGIANTNGAWCASVKYTQGVTRSRTRTDMIYWKRSEVMWHNTERKRRRSQREFIKVKAGTHYAITGMHFLHYWPFVLGIHMDSQHKEPVMQNFICFVVDQILNWQSSSQWNEMPNRSCNIIQMKNGDHVLLQKKYNSSASAMGFSLFYIFT